MGKKIISLAIIMAFHISLLSGGWKDIDKRFDDKWKELESKYEAHSKKLDEKFAKTLNEEWFNAKFKEAEKLFPEPKPVNIPTAPKEKIKPKDTTPVAVVTVPVVAPVVPVEPLPVEERKDEFTIEFEFFGEDIEITIPEKVKQIKPVALKNTSIADYWNQVSAIDHKNTLSQVQEYHTKILKNDWAYLMFVQLISKEVFPKNTDLQNLYTWFLLIKTGYQARIGYDDKRIYLLLPASTMIYGKTYFMYKGEKFYKLSTLPVQEQRGGIYTYPGSYPEANKTLELRVKNWPMLKKDTKKKDLTFKYGGKEYEIYVEYEGQIIKFVKDYPQTTIDAYAGAPLSEDSRKTMMKELAGILEGKSETEAVNILLAFVQKSFSYKTDDQQFGYEKWLFAEETLYYPYSDCEDRSVIFAQLVTELLGLKVVMLHYPQHMATAVLFSKSVSGDTVKYDGKWYSVCDPTYIGASYGTAMPQYKKVKPEVKEF